MAPKRQKLKKNALKNKTTQQGDLSDDELLNTAPESLSSHALLRLAHSYSEQEIFDRMNAVNPDSTKSLKNIRSRIWYAMNKAAKRSGRTMDQIRAEVTGARENKGVERLEVTRPEDLPLDEKRIIPSQPKVRFSHTMAPNLRTHILFVFVGSEREVNTIHTALIPASTRAILEERARQNMVQQQPIYLIDSLPESFEVYRLFLYTGNIYSSYDQEDQDDIDNGQAETHGDREWVRLAHVYLLGLNLDDEKFRNAVIDALIEKVTETDRYPTGIASEVYTRTMPGDKMRTLIVDLHVWKGQGTGVRPPHDDASGPMEFVQDVLRGLAEARSDAYDPEIPMPWEEDRCKYHSQISTEPCARGATAAAITQAARVSHEQRPLPVSSSSQGFSCTECDRTFSSSRSLNSHRQSAGHKEKLRALAVQAPSLTAH